MRKTVSMLLLLVMAAAVFAGCGKTAHEPEVVVETPAPVQEQAEPSPEPAVQTEVPAEEPEEPEEAQPEETAFDEEKYEAALKLVGAQVEELYEAIGYPEYQDYGPSCLEPGAEDGQLDYAGFSVFTLVQDQVETITEVLKDGEF